MDVNSLHLDYFIFLFSSNHSVWMNHESALVKVIMLEVLSGVVPTKYITMNT